MESCLMIPQRENCCPMFCILKSVLFAVVVVFMLFLPLGDPHVACQSADSTQNARKAMCYLCEGYFLVAKAIDKAVQAFEFASCVTGNVLYEAKLKFYSLLERMDKRDLCTSVCCTMDDNLNTEETKDSRCPNCKCVRKRCSHRPKTYCRYAQL